MPLSSSPPAARPRLLGRKRNLRLSSELEQRVDAAAAAAGLASSEWTRRAIASALGDPHVGGPLAAVSVELSATGVGPTGPASVERRVSLRAPTDEVQRWEVEAAEHGLNLARYVRLQMSVTPDQARRVATAVETLGAASVHIARIGRNLNQIARSINTMPGQTTAIQRRELSETCVAVDAFSDQITEVCGALNMKLGRRRARSMVGVATADAA